MVHIVSVPRVSVLAVPFRFAVMRIHIFIYIYYIYIYIERERERESEREGERDPYPFRLKFCLSELPVVCPLSCALLAPTSIAPWPTP